MRNWYGGSGQVPYVKLESDISFSFGAGGPIMRLHRVWHPLNYWGWSPSPSQEVETCP